MEAGLQRNFRLRFWIEAVLTAISGGLCLITPFWPDWIEAISGWDPDQHNGSVEWLISLSLLLATVALIILTTTEWRRTPMIE
jgi:hypothetical protein